MSAVCAAVLVVAAVVAVTPTLAVDPPPGGQPPPAPEAGPPIIGLEEFLRRQRLAQQQQQHVLRQQQQANPHELGGTPAEKGDDGPAKMDGAAFHEMLRKLQEQLQQQQQQQQQASADGSQGSPPHQHAAGMPPGFLAGGVPAVTVPAWQVWADSEGTPTPHEAKRRDATTAASKETGASTAPVAGMAEVPTPLARPTSDVFSDVSEVDYAGIAQAISSSLCHAAGAALLFLHRPWDSGPLLQVASAVNATDTRRVDTFPRHWWDVLAAEQAAHDRHAHAENGGGSCPADGAGDDSGPPATPDVTLSGCTAYVRASNGTVPLRKLALDVGGLQGPLSANYRGRSVFLGYRRPWAADAGTVQGLGGPHGVARRAYVSASDVAPPQPHRVAAALRKFAAWLPSTAHRVEGWFQLRSILQTHEEVAIAYVSGAAQRAHPQLTAWLRGSGGNFVADALWHDGPRIPFVVVADGGAPDGDGETPYPDGPPPARWLFGATEPALLFPSETQPWPLDIAHGVTHTDFLLSEDHDDESAAGAAQTKPYYPSWRCRHPTAPPGAAASTVRLAIARKVLHGTQQRAPTLLSEPTDTEDAQKEWREADLIGLHEIEVAPLCPSDKALFVPKDAPAPTNVPEHNAAAARADTARWLRGEFVADVVEWLGAATAPYVAELPAGAVARRHATASGALDDVAMPLDVAASVFPGPTPPPSSTTDAAAAAAAPSDVDQLPSPLDDDVPTATTFVLLLRTGLTDAKDAPLAWATPEDRCLRVLRVAAHAARRRPAGSAVRGVSWRYADDGVVDTALALAAGSSDPGAGVCQRVTVDHTGDGTGGECAFAVVRRVERAASAAALRPSVRCCDGIRHAKALLACVVQHTASDASQPRSSSHGRDDAGADDEASTVSALGRRGWHLATYAPLATVDAKGRVVRAPADAGSNDGGVPGDNNRGAAAATEYFVARWPHQPATDGLWRKLHHAVASSSFAMRHPAAAWRRRGSDDIPAAVFVLLSAVENCVGCSALRGAELARFRTRPRVALAPVEDRRTGNPAPPAAGTIPLVAVTLGQPVADDGGEEAEGTADASVVRLIRRLPVPTAPLLLFVNATHVAWQPPQHGRPIDADAIASFIAQNVWGGAAGDHLVATWPAAPESPPRPGRPDGGDGQLDDATLAAAWRRGVLRKRP